MIDFIGLLICIIIRTYNSICFINFFLRIITMGKMYTLHISWLYLTFINVRLWVVFRLFLLSTNF